ncbi:MAG: HD domain-containing protein [Chitinophagales bacterium]|nr:HD domain-containing protein [Chitinophagales bacterium]
MSTNKYKIINDPVYGFVDIPTELIYDVISHPYFQRLRRIRQMGLAEIVYPGATHTRFHHAIGVMHLMQLALNVLIEKGCHITELEIESALLAILLHDIGHGPFSHTLEATILKDIHHEEVSLKIFQVLNEEFDGKLTRAIEIFKGSYKKPFLHQLISGQLDMDRMDYLNRDSFYTGVAEGVIGYDRIIKMLDVVDDKLVVEEKGIYSIEKFIVSRRLMYWQVYLHKTSLSADRMLISALKRAKDLYRQGQKKLFLATHLSHFFENTVSLKEFLKDNIHVEKFVLLDDIDIWYSLKIWMNSDDEILSFIAKSLIDRNLFKIRYIHGDEEDAKNVLAQKKKEFYKKYPQFRQADEYFFSLGKVRNDAYVQGKDSILIKMKDGSLEDYSALTEALTIQSLSNPVVKTYICYPAI